MSGKLIAGHLEVFRDNIETEFKMECCTCNTSFIEYYDVGCIDNYDKTKKNFLKKHTGQVGVIQTQLYFNTKEYIVQLAINTEIIKNILIKNNYDKYFNKRKQYIG
jgi:hypothetical protein